MVSGEIGRERHISVKCYPVAAFSSNKTEKQFGLTRFVYLRHNTVLDKFLAKIETSASIELVGTRQQWLIALETKGRTDAFKDGIALELNHARCATTYAEWLKLVFESRYTALRRAQSSRQVVTRIAYHFSTSIPKLPPLRNESSAQTPATTNHAARNQSHTQLAGQFLRPQTISALLRR
ncbi:unnamed protein product [Tilletia controversa]|nr:unnamed protein product [Tilletia controversa]